MKLRSYFDFSKTEGQLLLVHSVRLAFVLVVFLITLSFQFLEGRVEATQSFYPIYLIIASSFILQVAYLSFFRNLYKNHFVNSFLFFFEAIYVSVLIYLIGIQQSVLIFLYLVNLILCGLIFQRKGALPLAMWTSILFSLVVSLDSRLEGHTSYLAVGVNNLAFFTVAYLSGFLSEQLNIMGEQLKESIQDVKILKNLNELILRNISVGLITVDNQQTILQANPGFYKQLGLEPSTVLGQELDQLIPGLNLDERSPGKEFDYIYTKHNEKRVMSVNYSPLIDETGQDQGKILTLADETHLRALEKRLRQSEKMAAIGGLAAGIAHEIRNPLAGISGSVQLLQAADADPQHSQKLMGIVIKEIDRLNNLITEFLDFAKPEAPLEDNVEIGRLVREVCELVSPQFDHLNVSLEMDIIEGVVVKGNKDKLKQALINIIVNAFQSMEAVSGPRLNIKVKPAGESIFVSVKDSGQGIKPETVDKIFEPFHTTKAKGTGLGLAITHSIIESHGGHISVESELGVGTEFQIRLTRLEGN
jgi:two-component system, NtrC family, sensor histidine kinase PilS